MPRSTRIGRGKQVVWKGGRRGKGWAGEGEKEWGKTGVYSDDRKHVSPLDGLQHLLTAALLTAVLLSAVLLSAVLLSADSARTSGQLKHNAVWYLLALISLQRRGLQ